MTAVKMSEERKGSFIREKRFPIFADIAVKGKKTRVRSTCKEVRQRSPINIQKTDELALPDAAFVQL